MSPGFLARSRSDTSGSAAAALSTAPSTIGKCQKAVSPGDGDLIRFINKIVTLTIMIVMKTNVREMIHEQYHLIRVV